MDDLRKLREMLCHELKEYGNKSELSAGTLDVVDKLTHTIKNLDKIIEEDGYSNHYPYWSYDNDRGYSRRRMYSRDGYSRDEGMVKELRDLMRDAPDDRTRQEFQRFINKIESM